MSIISCTLDSTCSFINIQKYLQKRQIVKRMKKVNGVTEVVSFCWSYLSLSRQKILTAVLKMTSSLLCEKQARTQKVKNTLWSHKAFTHSMANMCCLRHWQLPLWHCMIIEIVKLYYLRQKTTVYYESIFHDTPSNICSLPNVPYCIILMVVDIKLKTKTSLDLRWWHSHYKTRHFELIISTRIWISNKED
jgi:hypothetical protein